jgi:integrase
MALTNQQIRKLEYSKEPSVDRKTGKTAYPRQIIWDSAIAGLGVRVFPSGKKSFIYKYRTREGIQRLNDIAAVGEITVEQARETARKWAMDVVGGKDPLEEKRKSRQGQLIADLCEAYIERHAKPNKKSWKEDERRNTLYIVSSLGSMQVQQIKRSDIARLHDAIGRKENKPYMANRVREQLGKMFELAKVWGYVDESFVNPARGIDDFQERERDEHVKPEHMPILAKAIEEDENEVARCLIWLYLLTGKRRNELLTAKWSDLDTHNHTLKIADTKNNETEHVFLSDEARDVIERAKGFRTVGNPYIFPGDKPGGHFVNIRKPWLRIRKRAAKNGALGIDKVTIHGLRHTFAVWLLNSGKAELGLIRKLLNHKSLLATKVYAKYQIPAVKAAMNSQGRLVSGLMKTKVPSKKVLSLQSGRSIRTRRKPGR